MTTVRPGLAASAVRAPTAHTARAVPRHPLRQPPGALDEDHPMKIRHGRSVDLHGQRVRHRHGSGDVARPDVTKAGE